MKYKIVIGNEHYEGEECVYYCESLTNTIELALVFINNFGMGLMNTKFIVEEAEVQLRGSKEASLTVNSGDGTFVTIGQA